MTRCTNELHDHVEPAGTEVPDGWAPPSAKVLGDSGIAVLTEARDAICHDCGQPVHYDHALERYVHDDDPQVERCFLIPTRPEGATPCES